jgi:hypothetical protein
MIAIPLDLVEQIPVQFGHPEKTETTLRRQNHPRRAFPRRLSCDPRITATEMRIAESVPNFRLANSGARSQTNWAL